MDVQYGAIHQGCCESKSEADNHIAATHAHISATKQKVAWETNRSVKDFFFVDHIKQRKLVWKHSIFSFKSYKNKHRRQFSVGNPFPCEVTSTNTNKLRSVRPRSRLDEFGEPMSCWRQEQKEGVSFMRMKTMTTRLSIK